MVTLTKRDVEFVARKLSTHTLDNSIEDQGNTSIFGVEFKKENNRTRRYLNNDNSSLCAIFSFSSIINTNADGTYNLDDLIKTLDEPSKAGFGRSYTCIRCDIEELCETLCACDSLDSNAIRQYFYPNETVQSTQNINGKGNVMPRKTVQLTLIDPTPGIKTSDSLVANLGQFVVDSEDMTTIQVRVLSNPETHAEIMGALAVHNAKRKKIVNLEVLERTGNTTKLQEVLLEELTWEIK
jgi:hypothetical protein